MTKPRTTPPTVKETAVQHANNPLETAVKTAANRLSNLRASLDHLSDVAAPVMTGGHAAIAAEQDLIGDLQAASALGERVDDELKAARARLLKLRSEAAEADAAAADALATNAGLARRRTKTLAEIAEAEAALHQAEVALLRSMLEPAETAFMEAGRRAAEALRHFYGVHSALWERGVRPPNYATCAGILDIPIVGPVTLEAREQQNSGFGGSMVTVNHVTRSFGRGDDPIEVMLKALAGDEVTR